MVYLMYHEIAREGRKLCEREQGYARYAVSRSEFTEHVARMKSRGLKGVSVSEALTSSNQDQHSIAITFDDGCETDLSVAAPLLKEAGFNATFYIIAGRVGLRGYLTASQLQQLIEMGFEIGCHSMTHIYLNDASDDQLRAEVAEAKDRLEQMTAKRISHFSCPGGRWTSSVARVARQSGYSSVATSRIGANAKATDPFNLSRIAVMRGLSPFKFDRICRAEGFALGRARAAVFNTAKIILGNSIYERVRSSVLD